MIDDTTIELFRQDLPIIRAFAGWSVDKLAKLLCVSRQTIWNMEKRRMSVMQYLALSKLIGDEIDGGNVALQEAINILHGRTNRNITREKLEFAVSRIAHEIGTKKGSEALADALKEWMVRERSE